MIVAAWSGPRNLSTAMMYSFGARPDFAVWDEPFYAAYLAETGLDHPMRAEILAAGPCDAAEVARRCAEPPAAGHVYQKHMTHHMLARFERGWYGAVRHLFLIRHPARVLASYDRKRQNPTLDDLGYRQQAEIYAAVRGADPVVVDSATILAAPERVLPVLCERLGIGFDPAMLSWPAGGHPGDGVWAAHWYDAAHRSTGFGGPEGALPEVADHLRAVYEAALPYYAELKAVAMSDPS